MDQSYNLIKEESPISEITLECLMNKEQYAKYLDKKGPILRKENKKDKKFYRRRIFDLTKQMLSNEMPEHLMPDVKMAFENYIDFCINYFKVLDKTDILQEDYNGLEDIDAANQIDIDNIAVNSVEDANQLMMRSIKITQAPTLDNFVTIKTSKPVAAPIIPKKKEINLKDPTLKNKGICKKNNITNNYDKNDNKNDNKNENQNDNKKKK